MSLEREKQGLELKEYQDQLPKKSYAMRIGKEVPEGDVNLAYIHTPKVQADENISLIDTSYTSDNVIPQDQLESMVVANAQGELEYVDLIGNGEVRPKPPGTTFPSNKINVTRRFKKNEMRTENALFYKFEIDYHYDSKMAIPDDDGTYRVEKYTGQQIEITDENGNALADTYKFDIFVQAHAANPRVYSVRIYLHRNTDKLETFKVRYNHIDRIVPDAQIQSVQRSIEFYSNKDNTYSANGIDRQMLEGGKLRIINGVSSFENTSEQEVRSTMASGANQEIYAIIPKPDGSGYRIIVPQKSEDDPRIPRIFSHRVIAQYRGDDRQSVKVSVGHITDWVMNSGALLKNEQDEYSGEWKNIGLPAGGGKLNAKEMIEISLPFGTPSIPSDAKFFVEDDNGNLLYNLTNMTDNPNVDSQINEVMSKTVEAQANNLNQQAWTNAMQDNTVIKNKAIPHRASIIPERQETKWEFEWGANGQGYTEQTTNYKTTWQVCADIGFKKSINPQTLDLLDKSKWSTIGNEANVDKWRYSYVAEMGKNVIEYLENADDVVGFYQKQEMIDGSMTNLMSKTDYQFSAKVRLTDPVDDDAIGIMFRVRDAQNYYMFVWEKNDISTVNKTYTHDHGEGIVGVEQGCGRVVLNEYGYDAARYHPDGGATESWRWTNNKSKYLNEMGLGTKHKRILKATPNTLPAFSGSDYRTWNGNTRYPADKTNCKFSDITNFTTGYNAKGWEYGKDYKITVVVTGSLFRVYINENVDSSDLGTLVCQGTDETHTRGSYGIFCASQRWTYWYDLKMTEIEMNTVCSEKKEIVLTDTNQKKLSNYRAIDLMEPLIKDRAQSLFGGAPYEVFAYRGVSDGDFTITIDEIDGFIYGKTNNPAAGGVVRSAWTTEANGLSVKGKGYVEYHADGHFTVITDPTVLPTDQVPEGVLGFKWNAPWIISGENVSIALSKGNQINVTATVPPIRLIGTPYALEEGTILKSDGLKHLVNLFAVNGEDGFYDKLGIPADIPKDEILLRIERGEVTGLAPDGTAAVQNPEYRVNYRFRCQKDEFTRLPVDQFQDQLGVNRLRLKSILNAKGEFDPSVSVDVIAWTTFQELEAVPLFAVKVEEQRKIEIEKPKIELANMEADNWYLRVKNGRFLKRVILPYHEVGSSETIPQIYVSYPEMLGMVSSPNDVVEVDLEYSLPEYVNQEFHNRPYVVIDKEQPVVMNEYAIQTRYAPLVLQSETGKSFLEVYSIRKNDRRSLRVSDVDAAKGIVYLHDRIREQDDVYVRYAYKEDWFTYRGFYKEDVEYTITPQSQEITVSGSLTVEAVGSKSVTKLIDPERMSVFSLGQPSSDLIDGVYTTSPFYKGNSLPTFWESERSKFDIFNARLDLLLLGPYYNGMTETIKNDVLKYMHEKKGNVFLSIPMIDNQTSLTAQGSRALLEKLGVDIEYTGAMDVSNMEVNTGHFLFKGYVPNGKPFQTKSFNKADSKLIIYGSNVTPLAWSDSSKQNVIMAVYQEGSQLAIISTYSGISPTSDSYGWKPLMKALCENIVGHPLEKYEITTTESETVTFGPLSKTKTETLSSGESISKQCLSLAFSPGEFGTQWTTFTNKYVGYNLQLRPTLTSSVTGGVIAEQSATYGNGKLLSEQSMSLNSTFLVKGCVLIEPLIERKVIDSEFFHLDLNPTPGHKHTIAKNGFHRWIPTNNDQETHVQVDVDNLELLVKPLHIYLRPSVIRKVGLEGESGTPIMGTMNAKTLYHTDEEWWFNPKDYKYDPTMLRLGKVMLQANSTMQENMTILDTRTRGGGLDESLSKEIIRQVNKESLHHWDIGYFDGEAYQENGVIIVRLPRSILKTPDNPNGFHESEVQEAVAKHKGYGIMPIIEYYVPSAEENRYNIIPNPEFMYGKPIGYFDPVRTKAPYEILHAPVGSGDNYVLMLSDNGEYGITIPGHKFEAGQYRLDIKALKEQAAPSRSAGTVDIFYKNGSTRSIQLGQINRDQWMVYKEYIQVTADVHHITITLNKTPEDLTGRILYDYVMLHPMPAITEESVEIHEI